MKVLSIKQPWASLIVNGYKKYEFRTWKTKYRGEVLIHASKSYDQRIDQFASLNIDFPIGQIIGKVEITDCIEVNDQLKGELVKENELVYRNASGYAFKLENIQKFENGTNIKGQLGFFDYYTEFEIMDMMDDIEYGFKDKKILNPPKDVIKNKLGVCFEQVELERYYFKGYDTKTYFIAYKDDAKFHTHTFLVFKKDNKYYWFEHAYERFKGVSEYISLSELLIDVKSKFIKDTLNNNYDNDKLLMYEYQKPLFPLTIDEFFDHCFNGKKIELK